MNCKNCNKELSPQTKFCDGCGAKVINERITFKNILVDLFANAFGWDNKYFVTVRSLILSPQVLFKEYINGTRKRYVNPFAFFAIGAAMSLLIFNYFSEDYLRLSGEMNKKQMEAMNDAMFSKEKNDKNTPSGVKVIDQKELLKQQTEFGEKFQKWMLKYYNIIAFFLLPMYTLVAFLTFRKPYNYGEHLVINAYIQGITFIFVGFFFLLSLVTNPTIHFLGLLSVMIYYTYSYTKLYNFSFGQVILKVLKFLVLSTIILILIFVISGLIGFIFGRFF